jgi:hypothetical protein
LKGATVVKLRQFWRDIWTQSKVPVSAFLENPEPAAQEAQADLLVKVRQLLARPASQVLLTSM